MFDLKQKLANPFVQVSFIFVLFLLVNWMSDIAGSETKMPWTLAIAFQLLYIIYSIIIGLLNTSNFRYWLFAVAGYVILMFINSFVAGKISGITMDEAGTYRWIYFILIPVFLLFIVMANLIKKIVSLAEQDDRRFDNK
jgi:hypothetical protein